MAILLVDQSGNLLILWIYILSFRRGVRNKNARMGGRWSSAK
ncbi:hypothetical protein CSC17_3379 [Klebsiella oxytoca]|nr:hypothetical protein CSC17_3379 [Klebsiella oxytoca]